MKQRKVTRMWHPGPLETKCLSHLDSPEGWKILGHAMPPTNEVLPWSPFQKIFAINFAQFTLLFVALFFMIEKVSGMSFAEIKEDAVYGVGGALVVSAFLGAYVMHLYRRSWNRRARSMVFGRV